MQLEVPRDEVQIVDVRIRWLAIAAGCTSAVAGLLPFGISFPIIASILIVGALIQPKSSVSGRWLMWVGASILTVCVYGFLVPPIYGILSAPRPIDGMMLSILFLCTLSVFLVGLCDVTLVIDAIGKTSSKKKQHVSQLGEWLVRIVAAGLTLDFLTIPRAFSTFNSTGRWDILVLPLAIAVPIVSLDFALVFHAVKSVRQRAQRSTRPVM